MTMQRTWYRRDLVKGLLAAGFSAATPGVLASEPRYFPSAIQVTSNVHAIVGPLGQRSEANSGLNANYGFVVTANGVILIDSGASAYSAALLEKAVRAVTTKPIRWVFNTGSQDHRWLGNGYFSERGAEIHALESTVRTQREFAAQQMENLQRFVGQQLEGTRPHHATVVHPGPAARVLIDGVSLHWMDTSAHYPGDAMVHLPEPSVAFTGDLVYVDRLLGILPQSNVRKAHAGFERLRSLAPRHLVPGHGKVTTLKQAQLETGDYYAFLIQQIGSAARNMDPMSETLAKFASHPQFSHLQNFDELHRANMNRVFLDFEANP